MCPLPWALSDLWTWLSAIQEPPLPFSSLLLPGAPSTLQYPPHPTLAPESLLRAPSSHWGPAGTEGRGDRARLPREEFLQMWRREEYCWCSSIQDLGSLLGDWPYSHTPKPEALQMPSWWMGMDPYPTPGSSLKAWVLSQNPTPK